MPFKSGVCFRSSLVAQWIKDLSFLLLWLWLLLWCGFNPWPGNFCMLWAQLKKKKGVASVSYSPPALSYINPAGLQIWIFWGLVFPVQDPQEGTLNFRFLGRSSEVVNTLPVVSCLCRHESFDYTVSPSLPSALLWFLLYTSNYGRSFPPVFRLL